MQGEENTVLTEGIFFDYDAVKRKILTIKMCDPKNNVKYLEK